MRFEWFGGGELGLKRAVIAVILLGMVVSLVVAVPAVATDGGGKYGPSVRIRVQTNDDGRPSRIDPNDVGGISAAYDRWGRRSSDDPVAIGMTAARTDSDVARCKAIRKNADTFRVVIRNAYPGYACTFAVTTRNRSGVKLVVDDVSIGADPTLDLMTIDGPAEGDVLMKGRRTHGTYAVVVNQETPQDETLEFDVVVSYVERPKWVKPPKCWHRRWR